MKKFRQFFREKILLSLLMCALLFVTLITATYGWYAVNQSAAAGGMELKTGGIGSIKVALTPGGKDIMTDPQLPQISADGGKYAVIPIPLKSFENIREQTIAPGAWSPMTFYITPLTENIRSYSIKVQLQYKPAAGVTATQEEKIKEILKDHITVYEEMYTEDGIVRFRKPLTYYEKVTDRVESADGGLTFGKETKAAVYWVWNYEVTDVPDYEKLPRFAGLDRQSAIRAYDEEDTLLGNCIDGIYFNISIEGGMEGVKD